MSWKMSSLDAQVPDTHDTGAHHRPGRRCHWVQARLWPFVECELPAPERAVVAAHLPACPTCSGHHATTVRVRATLAPAPAPADGADVTPALAAAVARRLAERDAVRPAMVSRCRWVAAGGLAARASLCGIAMILVGWLLAAMLPGSPSSTPPDTASGTVRQVETRIAEAPSAGLKSQSDDTGSAEATLSTRARMGAALVRADRDAHPRVHRSRPKLNTQHSTLNTSRAHRRAPRPAEPLPAQQPETLPRPLRTPVPLAEQNEPVMLVREAEETAPSFAYARCVLPATNGGSATVVEVTREQPQQDSPVQVTLVLAGSAGTSETGKELLP